MSTDAGASADSAIIGETGRLVEPMRWWHVDDVARIESAVFPGDPWSVEQFWQELAQPTRRYVVCRDAGAVIGYGGAYLMPPDSDIQTLAVTPSHQGHGIARVMLDRLLGDARAAGCTHTILEVRSDNAAAIALYESRGFARISERRAYYHDGGDAVIMRCRLDGPDRVAQAPA
ncbi:MAG: ribosomal protein S18-alanine N-acetyltransferase [Actinomycetota bacterium]|nr:ribosomal protein S18-alanine N-acetyltransferase [Actinomycetota bacterium]